MNGKGPSSVALLFNFIIPFSEQLPTHDSIFAVFMCVCDSTITASSFKSMPDFVSVSIWDWLHVLIASEAKHPRNIRKFFLQKNPKWKHQPTLKTDIFTVTACVGVSSSSL